MIIETERLILRPWRLDDAESLFEYASHPDVGPAAGWPAHKSLEESRDVLKNILMNEGTWAVTLKGSDKALGSVGCFPSDGSKANGEPEIGYWIGVPFWGKGYIPEATCALMQKCFDEGAERVWCAHFEENTKSRRVIEKCGFRFVFSELWQREGAENPRPTLYYCMEREEWLK